MCNRCHQDNCNCNCYNSIPNYGTSFQLVGPQGPIGPQGPQGNPGTYATSLSGYTALAGGGQTGATLMTETKNRVDHAGVNGDSVILNPFVYNALTKIGTYQLVQNRSGFDINVFPSIGQDLGNGVNNPFLLPNGGDLGVQSYLTGTGTY